MPGDPCDADDAPLVFHGPGQEDIPPFCPASRETVGARMPCRLVCTGPAGCGDDIELTWQVDREYGPGIESCGCDGSTAQAHNRLPRGPWQWYGSCESPCEKVLLDFSTSAEPRNFVYDINLARAEVAPICTDCTQALEVDGVCRNPDGLEMPQECCACYVDDDGRCRSEVGDDFAISPRCCDGMPSP